MIACGRFNCISKTYIIVNLGHSFADVAFIKDRSSPNLVTVNEGDLLELQCNYCVVPSIDSAVLSWFKEDVKISNDSRHLMIGKNDLVTLKTEHSSDEGLFKCAVTFKKQNISRFITVIVNKGKLS